MPKTISKPKTKPNIKLLVARTTVIFAFIYLAYFAFVILPAKSAIHALTDWEIYLQNRLTPLKQSRTAITTYIALMPDNRFYGENRSVLLQTLAKSSDDGIKASQSTIPNKDFLAPRKIKKFVEADLVVIGNVLSDRYLNYFTTKKDATAKFITHTQIFEKVLGYIPESDFVINTQSSNDTIETLRENIIITKQGLSKNSDAIEDAVDDKSLSQSLDSAILQLDNLYSAAGTSGFDDAKSEFVETYSEYRNLAKAKETEFLKADDMLALITEETNLIAEYNLLLEKTLAEKEKINTDPVGNKIKEVIRTRVPRRFLLRFRPLNQFL